MLTVAECKKSKLKDHVTHFIETTHALHMTQGLTLFVVDSVC